MRGAFAMGAHGTSVCISDPSVALSDRGRAFVGGAAFPQQWRLVFRVVGRGPLSVRMCGFVLLSMFFLQWGLVAGCALSCVLPSLSLCFFLGGIYNIVSTDRLVLICI